MVFEFDPQKSRINKQKHGIDFNEDQLLWEDPDRIEVPARTTDEQRLFFIGWAKRPEDSACRGSL